ncbi:hypothetical protein OPV22_029972 [Ensete ventricosum]|uniref:Uncharacterized protein n=1 Tax=Ensete ventricosum TaxID=4639 RepID=A0AAV8QEU1_ENSVE|nr:hypothetical protein OPV22_029972 [Ensete ventricosum]
MSEHVQHKGDQDAEILLQVSDEELEPELGLMEKQILLPDCLLKTIEIKPSEKAGILAIEVSHQSSTI